MIEVQIGNHTSGRLGLLVTLAIALGNIFIGIFTAMAASAFAVDNFSFNAYGFDIKFETFVCLMAGLCLIFSSVRIFKFTALNKALNLGSLVILLISYYREFVLVLINSENTSWYERNIILFLFLWTAFNFLILPLAKKKI
jgi:asparagine N-glycosylation enzyme membrane subunit Stt3